ncbi:MAG TPA: AAA family ATPase [Phycisphaerales bacterium]|nr:AAA family ATPase [Phycisphaerales bacterium]
MRIRNFKRFDAVDIELGNPVVFIGPNDSGKTTALQALALWHYGVLKWNERRSGGKTPEKRPGVTINRKDLISLPVPVANLLWRQLHTHSSERLNGEAKTRKVYITIEVEGVSANSQWTSGFEFYYGNEESIYCRPARLGDESEDALAVPGEVASVRVAFMPAMSGLASHETRLDPGAINVRVGEGRTAEVLRNLCYRLVEPQPDSAARGDAWNSLTKQMESLFGVVLDAPEYSPDRGEITMTYREGNARLDLSCAGRGLQQVLLLLAYIYANPNSLLLIDEPDAHLEWLRQRQIYHELASSAQRHNCQIVAASHSEVLLNEAADRDVVVEFVGRPHRIDDRGSQVLKSLKEIGFEQYAQAEQRGWVLYLEGATDLAILQAWADSLGHPARSCLDSPFVRYVQNQPTSATAHFYGLREAKTTLVGVAILDRLDREAPGDDALRWHFWRRREIENYLCQPETLLAYAERTAKDDAPGELFSEKFATNRVAAMREAIKQFVPPVALADPTDEWWRDVKASDQFLDRVFAQFYSALRLPNLMLKRDYHVLAGLVPPRLLDPEVTRALDLIVDTASLAEPRTE